jgi:hypothetical protein
MLRLWAYQDHPNLPLTTFGLHHTVCPQHHAGQKAMRLYHNVTSQHAGEVAKVPGRSPPFPKPRHANLPAGKFERYSGFGLQCEHGATCYAFNGALRLPKELQHAHTAFGRCLDPATPLPIGERPKATVDVKATAFGLKPGSGSPTRRDSELPGAAGGPMSPCQRSFPDGLEKVAPQGSPVALAGLLPQGSTILLRMA